ncbi:hypothetical protein ACR820_34350 [Streptomyces netropsis]
MKTDPGGLPSAREIALINSAAFHPSHSPRFCASGIPDDPNLAMRHISVTWDVVLTG